MTRGEDTKLYIIGGFSTSNYFNGSVYVYDAKLYITAWSIKDKESLTGAKPLGLYGHSAVYNPEYKTIYIFGGHVFKDEKIQVSHFLFTFDVTKTSWNILQPRISHSNHMVRCLCLY